MPRLQIIRLDDELHVKLLGRVIEFTQRPDKALDRLALAIERDDDGVEGQFAVGKVFGLPRRSRDIRTQQSQAERRKKGDRKSHFNSDQYFVRKSDEDGKERSQQCRRTNAKGLTGRPGAETRPAISQR